MAEKKNGVVFNKLAAYQKKGCLFCEEVATLQADFNQGMVTTSIRCCNKESCKNRAAELAKRSVKRFRYKSQYPKSLATPSSFNFF